MDAEMQKKIQEIINDSKKARQERDTAIQERDTALNEIKGLKISLKQAVDLAQSAVTELKNVRDQRGKGKK
jgi:uncharacterized coiled-coil DUF342 family protein